MINYHSITRHTTHIKHNILTYYLSCVVQAKLANWGYIETHGSSGLCKDENDKLVDGSPIIIHSAYPNIPMNLCEINQERYSILKNQFKGKTNVKVLCGNCNELIDELHDIEDKLWYLHFVDPDGIRTDKPNAGHDQLTYETIRKIMTWDRRNELLMNFPLLPFSRWGSYSILHPEDNRSIIMSGAFTRFYGSHDWVKYYNPMNKPKWNFEQLIDKYIESLQSRYIQPIQKYLVKNRANAPQYYLIHCTNIPLGHLFMSKAFNKAETEWSKQLNWSPGQISLNNFKR